jgi:hypothetical protein
VLGLEALVPEEGDLCVGALPLPPQWTIASESIASVWPSTNCVAEIDARTNAPASGVLVGVAYCCTVTEMALGPAMPPSCCVPPSPPPVSVMPLSGSGAVADSFGDEQPHADAIATTRKRRSEVSMRTMKPVRSLTPLSTACPGEPSSNHHDSARRTVRPS